MNVSNGYRKYGFEAHGGTYLQKSDKYVGNITEGINVGKELLRNI